MRNTQRQKFPSTDPKRTITILKCFLCNQLFYAQNVFDAHMKQHQSKISRSIPEEIQRRTMDSFKNKDKKERNNRSNLLPVQGSSMQLPGKNQQLKSKKSAVMVMERRGGQTRAQSTKGFDGFSPQPMERKEYNNVDDILEQSTLLLERISFLTQQSEIETQKPKKSEVDQKKPLIIKKIINEKEFQESIISELKSSKKINIKNAQYLLLRTNFVNAEWKGYQQQYEYLLELEQQVGETRKIQEIKEKILNKVTQGIELSISTEKQSKNGNMVSDLVHCVECYLPIDPSSQYYHRNCGHYYHGGCTGENDKCC